MHNLLLAGVSDSDDDASIAHGGQGLPAAAVFGDAADPADGAALPAAAACGDGAAAPQGRGCGRGRGRGRGFVQSEATRARIAAGVGKRLRTKAQEKVEQLTEALAPELANQALRVVFQGAIASSSACLVDGTVVGIQSGQRSDASDKHGARVAVSHVEAQARGLGTALSPDDNEELHICYAFTTNSSDDASMWVQKPRLPCGWDVGAASRAARFLRKRLEWRGNNVHMPVLNINEELYTRRGWGQGLAGQTSALTSAQIFSPAQVVVSPNTATLRYLWSRWCISSRGAGHKLDPERHLQQPLDNARWLCTMRVADNLTLNACIICLEEESMQAQRATSQRDGKGDYTLLVFNCCAHSAVLSTKCVLEKGGTSSHLVRLFHQLEGGRRLNSFIASLSKIFKERWDYRPVVLLPPECANWRTAASARLQESRPCRDLSLEDEETLLTAFTFDWSDAEGPITHYCLRDCVLGCGCDENVSYGICSDLLSLALGSPPPTPLTYRWKGHEAAAAWAHRGRSLGDLLLLAFQDSYPEGLIKKAEEELRRHAENVAAGAQPVQDAQRKKHENNVKGGAVIKWLISDTGGKSIQRALFLCRPMQSYLNLAFKSEKMVGQMADKARRQSVSKQPTAKETDDLQENMKEAMKTNWKIMSGAAGEDVLAMYAKMMWDYQDSQWGPLQDDHDLQCSSVLSLCVVCADAWKRLVFDYKVPRFCVFESAIGDVYDQAFVQETARTLLAQRTQCEKCVDSTFTSIWCARLLDANLATSRLAWSALRDLMACAPVLSARTERKHLLGQAIRPVKRGRCVTAKALSLRTYIQEIKQANVTIQKRMEMKYFPAKGELARFHKCLAAFKIGRGRRKIIDGPEGVKKMT